MRDPDLVFQCVDEEWFFYGYNDRLVKLQTAATGEPASPTCMVAPPISLSRATKTEWQCSYSPSGEREIKRLVRSPKTDSTCGSVYPWTYYLLGTNDEQQVVYHGRQISEGACTAGPGRRVYFYPVEYRSYGVDGVNIVWERDANGAMVARFVGSDIQGSERYAVGKNAYQKVRDYLPFGVDVAVANDQRRGYLGKESDYETAPKYGVVHAGLYHERLMDMSARKYSKTQGAFTSVDALWGMTVGTSPYIYSHHDPINFADPSGYGEITHGGGGSGGVTSGGSRGNTPYWARNRFMLDAYSSDEARSINGESWLHRNVREALWPDQQPKSTGKKSQQRPTAASKPATSNTPSAQDIFDNPVGTSWNAIRDNVIMPAWNNPVTRYFIPDIYSVGIGWSGFYGLGSGASIELNWLLRGPDASFVPVATTTAVGGAGFSIDATVNLSKYNVLAPVEEITIASLETNIKDNGVGAWVSGEYDAGLVGGGTFSVAYAPGSPVIVGQSLNFGLGVPSVPAPFGAAAGLSNTYIIWRNKK